MNWLETTIPPRDVPLNIESTFKYVLPPFVCQYATAVLVLLPNTYWFRLALLPLTLYCTFQTATRLDIAEGWWYEHRDLTVYNQALVLLLLNVGMQSSIWTFCQSPLQRKNGARKNVFRDAGALLFCGRGHEWTWSRGLYVPAATRPTESRMSFVLARFWSALVHLFALDVCHYLAGRFIPGKTGIFDSNLPPFSRYLLSSFIATNVGLVAYLTIQYSYDSVAIIGVLLFNQSPRRWPPFFEAPWLADSLTDLWSKRWHQLLRECVVQLGYRPGFWLLGRSGGVMGAFFVSGLVHYFGLWGMGNGSDADAMIGFFTMMGFGIILEEAYKNLTGLKVGGFAGWLWTFVWVLCWANILVNAWVRKEMCCGDLLLPFGEYRLGRYVVEKILDML